MPPASPCVTPFPGTAAFLEQAQPALEACRPRGDLLLGMCLRMARYPEQVQATPHFLAVCSGHEPVLLAVLAPPWKIVVHDLDRDHDAAALALVSWLQAACLLVPGVEGPAEVADVVAERLAEASGRQARLERRQLLYELRTVLTPVPAGGCLRPAAEPDAPLVARWWHGSSLAAFGQADAAESDRAARRHVAERAVYVWDAGRPVSMALKTAPTPAGITVGRVYTPPEERGRGYATASVAELSRLLLAEGHTYCILFVDSSNVPAQRVYERAGYRPVGEFHEIALEE